MKKCIRSEAEIFSELAQLCISPGYVHAIAYFCFRDNTIRYSEELKPDDMLRQSSMERLVRTEISTLIGLACKSVLSVDLPSPEIIQEYIDKTETFLKEIHQSIMPPLEEIFNPDQIGNPDFNPFKKGSFLREPIFYGGESAYNFQYRDLSKIKYQNDNEWLIENKGFSIDQAVSVVASIQKIQNYEINEIMTTFAEKSPEYWSFLEAYTFSTEKVAKVSGHNIDIVRNVITSFASRVGMEEFISLDDFNPKNAYPIIGLENDSWLLFQYYSLVEALYETPFYWFIDDDKYLNAAMQHRGMFTEAFSAEKLKLVFGDNRVFQNIDIVDSKNNKAGEIDVLVVFSNRAIVLQAKSKRLTIASRKGNDLCIRDDFKKAVQDAYDQAYLCSILLTDKNYKLIDNKGTELKIGREYKEIYPFCVVSDHYPALSFQANQFLVFQQTQNIMPPFVMDVFFLDVMTAMLQSPLYLLSYINRRILYGDKFISTNELTILSLHLKQNLWMDDKCNMMVLEDSICADLDQAMLTRRDGVPGPRIPVGILTKYKGSYFGQIIQDIEEVEHPASIDLCFMLLTLGGEAIEMINDGIAQLVNLSKHDGKHHDLTLGISDIGVGLTIHLNDDPDSISMSRLDMHCEKREYKQKVDQWFGVCLDSNRQRLRFCVSIDFKWAQSSEMDKLVKDMPEYHNIKGKKKIDFQTLIRKTKKIGRNDKCPCGSGKKYKKCCLHKN